MTRREGELIQPKPWRQTVYICDRCKKEAPSGQWPGDPHGETEIACKTNGVAYSDYDDRTKFSIDLCPPCFVTWLIPLVEANGIKFNLEPADP
jgi:DNA-directed RNA polymerase subunit RPC12/RpoP